MSDPVTLYRRIKGQPIRRYQVLGERSSGTNLAHVLCKRNLNISEMDVLGWKHGFPSMLAVPKDALIIVSIRNVFDWVLSMHAKPWHASDDLLKLPFDAFLRAPWDSIVDRPDYFGMKADDLRLGTPLLADRHPVTGEMFGNLLAMRSAKLRSLLGLLNCNCNVAFVRMEDVAGDPEGFVSAIGSIWDIEHSEAFRGVTRRLGSRFKSRVADRPETPSEISAKDREFILDSIDPALEAKFAYHYD